MGKQEEAARLRADVEAYIENGGEVTPCTWGARTWDGAPPRELYGLCANAEKLKGRTSPKRRQGGTAQRTV